MCLCVNYCAMLYDVCLIVLFVCVVFARFACDVWRDGVRFVFCVCVCLCAVLLMCLCGVCVIYYALLSGLLFVLFCNCARGF